MTEPTATAPTSAALTEAVEALRKARAAAAINRGELAIRQQRFAEENAAWIDKVREDAEIVAANEVIVRALALAAYAATKDTKPASGISIEFVRSYDIDATSGLAWAKEHQICLVPATLDLDAIKKLATVQELPFVTVTEAPKPFIATDLDKALSAEPKAAA